MMFEYLKAFHVIFVFLWMIFMIAWGFASSLASVHPQSPNILSESSVLKLNRLWILGVWPCSLFAISLGLWTLYLYDELPPWMILKILHALLIFMLQIQLSRLMQKPISKSSHPIFGRNACMRWIVLSMISIVFLVIVKDSKVWLAGYIILAFANIIYGRKPFKKV